MSVVPEQLLAMAADQLLDLRRAVLLTTVIPYMLVVYPSLPLVNDPIAYPIL